MQDFRQKISNHIVIFYQPKLTLNEKHPHQ